MADDIVGLLTAACECGPLDPDDACLSCLARAEIERLRVRCGDVIAAVLTSLVGDRRDVQRLLNTWDEARQ